MRTGLTVAALIFFGIGVVTLAIALIADAVDPTIYNPFASVVAAVPFALVLGINALVWRALVGPISRAKSTSRVVFVVLVTLGLAFVSVILVVIIVLLTSFLPS